MRVRVAGDANRAVVRGALILGQFPVRIVTTETREPPFALPKAAALLESIRMMVDFEAVGARDPRVGDVDAEVIRGQRLTRSEGIDVSAEAANAGNSD